jgi:uncharacterized protein (DUF427 family)
MARAIWNGIVLAESDQTVMVEGNHYFPPNSINRQYFEPSQHRSICYWKGQASYFHVTADGQVNKNAAWYYPDPKDAARHIKDYVAFWRGVTVEA